MSAHLEKERQRLEQKDVLKRWTVVPPAMEMLTIHLSEKLASHDLGIYCALIPNDLVEEALSRVTWDLMRGDGKPDVREIAAADGEVAYKYFRFGGDDVEPFVIWREFHGLRAGYVELSEEFRLFHNLYHDQQSGAYLSFDEAGNENVVARVAPTRVEVRVKELRQYLAARAAHLALYFDSVVYSDATVEELQMPAGAVDLHNGLSAYGINYGGDSFGPANSWSRLLGKQLIEPYPMERCGLPWVGEPKPNNYADFIIGVDEYGEPIWHSAYDGALNNNFNACPGAPHYLTKVCFKKHVLDKYYQQPSRYSVEDSYLRCGGLWGITIDNHHPDYVWAWLGDLGRDLPYSEQEHWKAFNIPPQGKPSDTFVGRQLLGQWLPSARPEDHFRHSYEQLAVASDRLLKWPLLKPLNPGDAHCLDTLRLPINNEQQEFDGLVQALAKILVDRLNEKKLVEIVQSRSGEVPDGGINRLESTLQLVGVSDAEQHINFLRRVQNLRSALAAHSKDSRFEKISAEVGLPEKGFQLVFRELLEAGVALLEFLKEVVQSGKLSKPAGEG